MIERSDTRFVESQVANAYTRIKDSPIYLTDLVTRLATTNPDWRMWHLLFPDRPTQTITPRQLDRDARHIAARLEEQGVTPGVILPLVFDHSYELLAAFWGAMYLGAVPTILPYLSAATQSNAYLGHLRRLVQFVDARAIVTMQESKSYLEQGLVDSGCDILTLPPLTNDTFLELDTRFPKRNSSNLPYIQFSSGTTGTPKGVMLTHDALLHYLEVSSRDQAATPKDMAVGWLPLYHDMGLVNQILSPLFIGYPSVLMSPADWLHQPQRLFEAVHAYRGSITWMPNFAFRYCVRRIRDEQLAGLDLSSWRILGNGSEPTQAQDLDAFTERFAPYGFNKKALTIGYGLAEHVAGVTWVPHNHVPKVDWVSDKGLEEQKALAMEPYTPGGRPIVSCGYPIPTVDIRIVNDEGQDLPERQVGQVFITSPCLFHGYYLAPEESARVLNHGWLNTEDVGYIADGQLYICGRKKDLMIIGGRNIHPTHLEAIVESVLGKECRYVAGFGVPNPDLGTEMPVVVCEMRELPPNDVARNLLQRKIREQVQQALDLFVSDVYLVDSGWILKTTSGKINRTANRAKYLAEQTQREQNPPPVSDTLNIGANLPHTQQQLLIIWQKLFKHTDIHITDNFFELGGDSLLGVQLILEIEQQFGRNLSEAVLVQSPTIVGLAAILDGNPQSLSVSQVVALQPGTPQSQRPIFFCVHGLGGGLLIYNSLVNALGPAQPFYGLQPLGSDGTLQPYKSIPEMAARYIQAIQQIQPHGPYYVGGHCFGGMVAFEIAHQLALAAEPVALVALFGGAAPLENVKRDGFVHKSRYSFAFARNLPFWLRDYIRLGRYKMNADNRRVLRLFRKRALQWTGQRVVLDTQDVVTDVAWVPEPYMKVVETHMAALHNYTPTPYDGRLVLFRSNNPSLQSPERDMGWRRLTTGPVDIHFVPGSLRTMLNESNVHAVADKLNGYLTIEYTE